MHNLQGILKTSRESKYNLSHETVIILLAITQNGVNQIAKDFL